MMRSRWSKGQNDDFMAAERFRQNVRARERLMQEVTAAEVKTQSRQ